MTLVPPQMSGVVGALLQSALQVGVVMVFSIQAGFLTIKPGNFTNYANIQASFWFQFGWLLFNALIIAVFFRVRKPEAPKIAAEVPNFELKRRASAPKSECQNGNH
jgi:hypothetical protein